ncbi:hypothetical protein ACQVTU_31885 [Bacillus cereus]|uniref:hypothetical protein n=1 Tax=Bacillus cereus TaxID=1396 RepID=UPI003D647A24
MDRVDILGFYNQCGFFRIGCRIRNYLCRGDLMDNNVNISITNPQSEERGFGGECFGGIWGVIWIVLIIVFVLFFITQQGGGAYPMSIGAPYSSVNSVQTVVNQDKIYITNANTGLLSIIDTKTDQLKSILPFR